MQGQFEVLRGRCSEKASVPKVGCIRYCSSSSVAFFSTSPQLRAFSIAQVVIVNYSHTTLADLLAPMSRPRALVMMHLNDSSRLKSPQKDTLRPPSSLPRRNRQTMKPTMALSTLRAYLAFLPFYLVTALAATKRPNLLFVLTDDQDWHMQSLDYMPLLHKYLINEGTLFDRHYCTVAICCPSRVNLWTGRTAHNVGSIHSYGGSCRFLIREDKCHRPLSAVWRLSQIR